MKKLAIICGSLSRGGAERVSIHLAKFFTEKKYEVFIMTSTKRENEYEVPSGVVRICLDENAKGKLKILSVISRLRSEIKNRDIDTVIIMDTPTCIYGIPGCMGTNAKVIVSERNAPTHFAGKKITKHLSRFLMKRADGYVFQTNEAKEFYKEKLKSKGVVIPNPIIVENLPELYTGEPEKVIVSAGRLDPQKNQKLLIGAFSKIADEFPEYKLVIYGEGSLRTELEEQIKQLGLQSRVLLPGTVTDLHDRIRTASLFVFPSNFEGMPNALIEAMALGLPCISTDCPCGGPRELIVDGENGFLVPVNDEIALANMIRELLQSKTKMKFIGRNALKIRDILNMKNIGPQWLKYLT